MDPINDVNRLCPCWIIMNDGSRHRCDAPVGLSGNLANPMYSFLSGTTQQSVQWGQISAFESIANPADRIAVR